MANFFDQFDVQQAPATRTQNQSNFFDQFDGPDLPTEGAGGPLPEEYQNTIPDGSVPTLNRALVPSLLKTDLNAPNYVEDRHQPQTDLDKLIAEMLRLKSPLEAQGGVPQLGIPPRDIKRPNPYMSLDDLRGIQDDPSQQVAGAVGGAAKGFVHGATEIGRGTEGAMLTRFDGNNIIPIAGNFNDVRKTVDSGTISQIQKALEGTIAPPNNTASRIGEQVGDLASVVPLAAVPGVGQEALVFGIAARRLDEVMRQNFEQGKSLGMSDEQASNHAYQMGVKAALADESILRPLNLLGGEGASVLKGAGRNVVEKFVLGRLGSALNMGGVMGGSAAAENVAQGKPATQGLDDVVRSALITGALLPGAEERPNDAYRPKPQDIESLATRRFIESQRNAPQSTTAAIERELSPTGRPVTARFQGEANDATELVDTPEGRVRVPARVTEKPTQEQLDAIGSEIDENPEVNATALDRIKSNGSVTIDIHGNEPKNGFAFAPSKDTETKFPEKDFSPDQIKEFRQKHAAALQEPGNHIVGRNDGNGNIVLDISNVSDNLADALVKARDAKQDAIFDLGSFKEIPVSEGLKQLSPNDIADAEARAKQPSVSPSGDSGVQSGLRGPDAPQDARAGNTAPEGLANGSNAETEAGRAATGLPERDDVVTRTWGEAADAAQKLIAQRPNYGRNLVEKFSKGAPKAANDIEHAGLSIELNRAYDDFDRANKAVNDAPGDKAALKEADMARERMQKVYEAFEKAGTGTGRGLAIRKAFNDRFWSKANMESYFRAKANGGAALTKEQIAAIDALHRRVNGEGSNEFHLRKDAGVRAAVGDLSAMWKGVDELVRPEAGRGTGQAFGEAVLGKGQAPIVSPAIRLSDGSIYTGEIHQRAIERAVKERGVSARDLQPDLGFVDASGEFLDRGQASARAVSAGQIDRSSIKSAVPGYTKDLHAQDFSRGVKAKMQARGEEGAILNPFSKRIAQIKKGEQTYKDKVSAGDTSPVRPLRNQAESDEVYRANYDRERAKADFHAFVNKQAYMQKPAIVRAGMYLASRPRAIAVSGHGIVFPVTHAGDLILNPTKWGTFQQGFLRTYAASFNEGFHQKVMGRMHADDFFGLAHRAGLDVAEDIHGSGLVSREGMGARAWDALKVMRFELWKKQMAKYLKPGMSEADRLDLAQNLATWANHATGSGKGKISQIGGSVLFGPKLTQSKINRLFVDPAKTVATFANWKNATVGERAVAMTRLKGMTAYATTLAGFLVANQALLSAQGSKQKVNFSDPNKADFWSFKVAGTDVAIPGMHSEMRYLARMMAVPFESGKTLKGSKQDAAFGLIKDYGRSKLAPTVQLGVDAYTGQDYRGRPLPWSKDQYGTNRFGTQAKYLPRYSATEYGLTKAPIPLTGPAKYVYDQMREKGMSAKDAALSVKALTIFGLGATGMHVHEDFGN
jgi:hypothetical protein